MLKKFLKKLLFNKGVRFERAHLKTYILYNVHKTSYQKTVLISHLTEPFMHGMSYNHTAFSESIEISNVFSEMGYNVDVVNYNDINFQLHEINIEKYSVIFGQGYPMDKIFSYPEINKITTIIYATGCHTFYLNTQAFKRLKQNYLTTNRYLVDSMIFNRFLFPLQLSLSDFMIIWGTEFTKSTYIPYYIHNAENISCVTAFFHKIHYPDLKKKDFFKHKNSFLFFGSSGLIHRGLDLVIDYFVEHPTHTLHICGSIFKEMDFYNTYKPKLDLSPNIFVHGFVDITSNTFREILEQVTFYIYPSASEGTSTSALTAIGNGGLIPLITQQSGLEVDGFGIIIEEINKDGIEKAVQQAMALSVDEIKVKAKMALDFTSQKYTVENFKKSLYENFKKFGL